MLFSRSIKYAKVLGSSKRFSGHGGITPNPRLEEYDGFRAQSMYTFQFTPKVVLDLFLYFFLPVGLIAYCGSAEMVCTLSSFVSY